MLRDDHPQIPGVGISGGRDSRVHAALHDAQAKRDLHWHHARQRLVILVGQKRALAMAVKGKQTERRWSKLADWLRGVAA